jgi:hypothetical protein
MRTAEYSEEMSPAPWADRALMQIPKQLILHGYYSIHAEELPNLARRVPALPMWINKRDDQLPRARHPVRRRKHTRGCRSGEDLCRARITDATVLISPAQISARVPRPACQRSLMA